MIAGLNKLVLFHGMGYLMSPYSNLPDRDQAARMAAMCCGALSASGLVIQSPIVHGHTIQPYIPLPPSVLRSHTFWIAQCERLYSRCEYGIVAMIHGWGQSKGIAMEVYRMTTQNKQVLFFQLPDDEYPDGYLMTIQEAQLLHKQDFEDLMTLGVQTIGEPYLQANAFSQSKAYSKSVLIAGDGYGVPFEQDDPPKNDDEEEEEDEKE